MNDNLLGNTNPSTPDLKPLTKEFISQVKKCLEHLFDPLFLQNNPLIFQSTENKITGQMLRIELISAIESMNPSLNVTYSSREIRMYKLLHLRYIQKMGIEEIGYTLGMSPRQVHRDLRTSEGNLAAIAKTGAWRTGKPE